MPSKPINEEVICVRVLKSASIIGTVRYERGSPDKVRCACCPGEAAHIFSRYLELEAFASAYPKHFGHGLAEFVGTQVLYGGFEGKRVRVTIEVLEESDAE